MRQWIDLFESTKVFVHGSRTELPIGTVLVAQPDGYVSDIDAKGHHLTERIMEEEKPEGVVSRKQAVYMVLDPQEIDYAGGYDDHVYTVKPLGPVHRCNLSWYSEAFSLAEDIDFGGNSDIEDIRLAARNYWAAKPHGPSDLYEFLTEKAEVLGEFDW